MKMLGYILAILVATVPLLWLEDYTITHPVWWTATSLYYLGRLFGYFEGLKEKEDESCKE